MEHFLLAHSTHSVCPVCNSPTGADLLQSQMIRVRGLLKEFINVGVRIDLQRDPRQQHFFPALVTPPNLGLWVGIVAIIRRVVPRTPDLQIGASRGCFCRSKFISNCQLKSYRGTWTSSSDCPLGYVAPISMAFPRRCMCGPAESSTASVASVLTACAW